jgi:hypothetical protein
MPKYQPLLKLGLLERGSEAKLLVLVIGVQQVEELGRGFKDGERWGLIIVDKDRDAA